MEKKHLETETIQDGYNALGEILLKKDGRIESGLWLRLENLRMGLKREFEKRTGKEIPDIFL